MFKHMAFLVLNAKDSEHVLLVIAVQLTLIVGGGVSGGSQRTRATFIFLFAFIAAIQLFALSSSNVSIYQ